MQDTTQTSLSPTREAASRPRLPVWQVLTAGVAAPVATWTVLSATGVDLMVDTGAGSQHVGVGAVVVSALLAALGGLGVAWLLRRVAGRPRRAFLVVAIGVLMLSLLGPIGAALSTGAALALVLLHLSVGVTVIPLVAGRLALPADHR